MIISNRYLSLSMFEFTLSHEITEITVIFVVMPDSILFDSSLEVKPALFIWLSCLYFSVKSLSFLSLHLQIHWFLYFGLEHYAV